MPLTFKTADFGDWQPDQPDLLNPAANVADNVVFIAGVYRSIPAPVRASVRVPNLVHAAWVTDPTGNVTGIGMARDNFYTINATGASPIYSGGLNGVDWQYTVYGNYVIFVDAQEQTFYYDMGSGLNVQPLPNAPRASWVTTVRQFVMVGNTIDEDGARVQRVRWSAFDNPLDWAPSPTTQADFQDLAGTGGEVTGIIGGEYAVIFQQHSIWRATYIGAPLVFQFDEVERGRGAVHGSTIIDVGSMPDGGRGIFYLATDGFYRFTGQTSAPLGIDRVNITVKREVNFGRINEASAAANPDQHLVFWSLPVGANDFKLYIYNYHTGNWSCAPDIKAVWLGQVGTGGYTLDNLPYSNIDTMPVSLDSPVFIGSSTGTIAMFDTDGYLCYFSGTPLPATIETGEVLFGDGAHLITQCRALVAGDGNLQIQTGYRLRQSDPIVWTPLSSPSLDGAVKFRAHARFFRSRVKLYGVWDEARGIIYNVEPRGRR
jgi:hypothetical protein